MIIEKISEYKPISGVFSPAEARCASEAEAEKKCLLFQGAQDSIANLSHIKGLGIPALWKVAIQVIPDSDHAPQWEQRERFNSLLREFIKDCRR